MNAQKNPIIIFGSSRGDGNTLQAVRAIIKDETIPFVNLSDLQISYYDYEYTNKHDDFIPLMERIVGHNPIILATPVYWHSMSAIMKTFIDRWCDLTAIRKDLGKGLANKDLYVITSYAGSKPAGFEYAFIETTDYMDMHYKGCFYYYSGKNSNLRDENSLLSISF